MINESPPAEGAEGGNTFGAEKETILFFLYYTPP